MQRVIDIKEDDILKKYPKVLDTILFDQTTQKNIFWATNNYEHLGSNYNFESPITTELITGSNDKVIMPRVLKDKELQRTRVKDMAEVYTPSWICNEQNNSVDNIWFNKKNVFNEELIIDDKTMSWKINKKKIKFPKNKTWKDYVKDIRLEVSCGEAPYLTSRYDTTNGEYISIENRIGLLDRKLRIISENTNNEQDWIHNAKLAYQSIYAYEFHGDSLLLARESLLYSFIENYFEKFDSEPNLEDIQEIAYVISWNIWQMDGLKAVIPNSCISETKEEKDLFDDSQKTIIECKGCKINNINSHNGEYNIIMDWTKANTTTNKQGLQIKFVDLIQN